MSVFHVPSFKSIIKVSEAQDAKSHHPLCPLPLPWLLHLVSDHAPSMCSLSSLHSPLVGFSLSPLLPTLVSYLLPLPLLLPPHSMQTTLDTIFLSTVLITLPLCSRTDHTPPHLFLQTNPKCLAWHWSPATMWLRRTFQLTTHCFPARRLDSSQTM